MVRGAPVGWPADLPPPGSDEFAARVTGWLLDRGSADLRTSALRQYPVALARVTARGVAAQLDGVRGAYASARVELGEYLTPEQVDRVQAALEAEGARLLTAQREIALVEEALRAQSR